MATIVEQRAEARRVVDRLLSKWAVERETSLDITTIYRRMKAGTFPQPVRVGKRRVAWRESDIAAWQAALEVAHGCEFCCGAASQPASERQRPSTTYWRAIAMRSGQSDTISLGATQGCEGVSQ